MKTDIYTQYEGIQTQDLQTMLDAMNRSMREHSDGNPKGRWEMMNGQFIGVVEYSVTDTVPETELERMEQEYGRYQCIDCPFIEMDGDKRKKCFPCVQKWQTRVDSPCCEWFYQQLEAGTIKVGE